MQARCRLVDLLVELTRVYCGTTYSWQPKPCC